MSHGPHLSSLPRGETKHETVGELPGVKALHTARKEVDAEHIKFAQQHAPTSYVTRQNVGPMETPDLLGATYAYPTASRELWELKNQIAGLGPMGVPGQWHNTIADVMPFKEAKDALLLAQKDEFILKNINIKLPNHLAWAMNVAPDTIQRRLDSLKKSQDTRQRIAMLKQFGPQNKEDVDWLFHAVNNPGRVNINALDGSPNVVYNPGWLARDRPASRRADLFSGRHDVGTRGISGELQAPAVPGGWTGATGNTLGI